MNLNSMQPTLARESRRRAAILDHQVDRHTPIRQAAEALGRRNVATAKARTLTQAVSSFVHELYDRDAAGRWWNVDARDGRILIACPWGRAGHRLWGLRRGEGDILRMFAMLWQNEPNAPFVYSPTMRQWRLDYASYPEPADVMRWLDHHLIDAEAWGILHAQYIAQLHRRTGKGSRRGSRGGSPSRSPQ